MAGCRLVTEVDLASQVRESGKVVVTATGSRRWAEPSLELGSLRGIIDLSPADQVAVVWAGTPLREFQDEVQAKGLCLPLDPAAETGSLGGALAWNFPQTCEGKYGSWRDWVLGLTLISAAGDIVECGSRAVKNVAGYDLTRLVVGSRGSLAIVTKVVVRLYPLKGFKGPAIETHGFDPSRPHFCQRVLRSDLPSLCRSLTDGGLAYAADPDTATVWVNHAGAPTRFEHDWVAWPARAELDRAQNATLVRRLKSKLDPTNKLHPGVFGDLI